MKPKLTLRDLFWLTLVVAMACAWLVRDGDGGDLIVVGLIVVAASSFFFLVGLTAGLVLNDAFGPSRKE